MFRDYRGSWMGLALGIVLVLAAGQAFAAGDGQRAGQLRIGWASAYVTPDKPVVMGGAARARVATTVLDPVTATALAIESVRDGKPAVMAILVSCDLLVITDALRDRVRELVKQSLPDIDAGNVVLNATHTHTAPSTYTSPRTSKKLAECGLDVPLAWSGWGIELCETSPQDFREFAAKRIAVAVGQAWKGRKPGGVSFGLGHAVVGHNRLTAYTNGRSSMYGKTNRADFSHVEGYEDHSVNLLYTWSADRKLTGVVVNIAMPSQAGGCGSRVSADFWHDTRNELRRRLGKALFVLPQCSAAGDQSPNILVDKKAEARMQRLTHRSWRGQIAVRLADAVTSVLPIVEKHIDFDPVFAHRVEQVPLTRRRLSEKDIKTPRRTPHRSQVETTEQAFERLRKQYAGMRAKLEAQPELKKKRHWFNPITAVYWRLRRVARVLHRYELQKTQPTLPVEVHIIRLGDIVFATNRFELYIDYGMRIKARSKAVQTFIVQLAGQASYLPTKRSVAGGAYGAVPESTEIGPVGGQMLVERTVELINSMWPSSK